MNAKTVRKIEVLLVEDNPGDILLTQEALKGLERGTNLSVVRDGEEAMNYLRKEGAFSQAITPDIVLLDLNLPRMDGREVLAEIKRDPALRKIPVVVLTSSEAESDILQTYDLYVNCYIVKPADYERFITVVQSINYFWLGVVKLPTFNRV